MAALYYYRVWQLSSAGDHVSQQEQEITNELLHQTTGHSRYMYALVAEQLSIAVNLNDFE